MEGGGVQLLSGSQEAGHSLSLSRHYNLEVNPSISSCFLLSTRSNAHLYSNGLGNSYDTSELGYHEIHKTLQERERTIKLEGRKDLIKTDGMCTGVCQSE